jgi:hypothetical protein
MASPKSFRSLGVIAYFSARLACRSSLAPERLVRKWTFKLFPSLWRTLETVLRTPCCGGRRDALPASELERARYDSEAKFDNRPG